MTDGISALAAFATHCQDVAVVNGPIFLGLFVAGLVGSASHCVGMCGPFVLAQTGERMAAVPVDGAPWQLEIRRLKAALALPYQAGRATTYVLMGAALAAPFRVLGTVADWPLLVPSLLAFAAVIFAGQAWRGFGLPAPQLWSGGLSRFAAPLLRTPFGWRGFVLGILLGFLPCGLLYGALAAAAATADPLAAAIGMLGFVMGTLPALGAVGYLGGRAGLRWRFLAQRALPFVAGMNACILLAMAVRSALSA